MITNALFRSELAKIPEKDRNRYELMYSVSERISVILKKKGMTQKDLALQMGKKEQEISKWMCGFHNFTLATIADISCVLGENIIKIDK